MEEAFKRAAEQKPDSPLSDEVNRAEQEQREIIRARQLRRLAGQWKLLGDRVFEWNYDPRPNNLTETFWKQTEELMRLKRASVNISIDDQTAMLGSFVEGLRLSESTVDPKIFEVHVVRLIPELLVNSRIRINTPTFSPVSNLFLDHYSSLSEYDPQKLEEFMGYVVSRCAGDGAARYIALPEVLPATAEWTWHSHQVK